MLTALIYLVVMSLFLGFGCISVDNISEDDECGANPGGLVTLYVIRRSDIETFPAVSADGVTITAAIVPKEGKGFAKWDLEMDTAELTHKSSGDPGSQSVETELEVYISRGKASIDAVIQNCINGKFVVIGVDAQGQKRIGGNVVRPLTFSHEYKGGKKLTDKNGTTIKFTGGTGNVPYYYTNTIPVIA